MLERAAYTVHATDLGSWQVRAAGFMCGPRLRSAGSGSARGAASRRAPRTGPRSGGAPSSAPATREGHNGFGCVWGGCACVRVGVGLGVGRVYVCADVGGVRA
eukprot:4168258-Pleurochrysis_carterae.AAC.1